MAVGIYECEYKVCVCVLEKWKIVPNVRIIQNILDFVN